MLLRTALAALVAGTLSLTAAGCLKKVLVDGQVKGTRQASRRINTFHDFEIARSVAEAGMGQLEGMHELAPENADGLFLLTRGWAGVSSGFTEDDYEDAVARRDDVLSEYHLRRLRAGHRRAKHYGQQLVGHVAGGFDEARRNSDTMRAWLLANFKHEAEAQDLLWTGFAWIGEVAASTDVPAVVAELYVGVELVRRSVELDETVDWGMGHVILGGYHARSALAELDESKKHFDRALALNSGKFLPTKVTIAQRYHCVRGDKAAYTKTLEEVVAAGDPLPEARLQNTIAMRKARRYLDHPVFQEECGF
jgi:hypothetical protein